MSVVVLGGERYAAGLDWTERAGRAATARRAREHDRPFVVHWRDQTGFGPGGPESVEGLPSLAAALSAHVGAASFVALVEGQGGRFALTRVRDGIILADGDEVFDDREAALAAFERARRAGGWAPYATPGLAEARSTSTRRRRRRSWPPRRGRACRRPPSPRFFFWARAPPGTGRSPCSGGTPGLRPNPRNRRRSRKFSRKSTAPR